MSKCQCSLSIRLTGDGCRYCQPQEYIDRLHDNAKDDHAAIDALNARVAELEAALRACVDVMHEIGTATFAAHGMPMVDKLNAATMGAAALLPEKPDAG